MRKWFKKHLIFALAALTVLAASACRNEILQSLEKGYLFNLGYVQVAADFCTSPPAKAKQKIKYIFILDHSQSNQPGFPNPLTPSDTTSTDPQGSRRYGPLVQFLQNLVPDPNNMTYFALIDFNDTAYEASVSGFDPDVNSFLSSVKGDWVGYGNTSSPVPRDQGFTNYQSALQLADQLIRNDVQLESGSPVRPIVTINYQVIFVSDGVPTIISNPGSMNPVYTQDFTADIQPLIDSIISMKNDPVLGPFISNIALNTAYYFQDQEIVAAETLLQKMAAEGNGQYLQFAKGKSIIYQAFAPPIRNIKYNLADVWVENKNAVWWDDGRLLGDSDGDGIPDEIEDKMGSNPFSADSDGNGVSDLVEFRTKGRPCQDSKCKPINRDPYSICDGFAPSVSADGSVHYPSSANDGLNDCEKFVLGANITTFDSNGDFISDLLSLKSNIPFIAGTLGSFADPFADGVNNYNKLKMGYAASSSMKKALNFTARSSSLIHEESSTLDIECYHMTIDNVAVMGAGNTIRVSIIENNAVIDNKPILRFAERTLQGQETPVVFTQGDFR